MVSLLGREERSAEFGFEQLVCSDAINAWAVPALLSVPEKSAEVL
jgi:hypothetical protein